MNVAPLRENVHCNILQYTGKWVDWVNIVANESFGCQKAQANRVNWHNIE